VAIARDISDRKQMEEILIEEKKFSESAINSLPGIFYLFDENGNILRWNKNYEKVSEYSPEEILKLNPLDLVPDEDKEITTEKIKAAFAEGEATLEANILTKTGKKIPYDFTGLRMIVNGKKYIVGMGIDITERKKTEKKLNKYQQHLEELVEKRTAEILRTNKELRESEEKYRTLIENLPQKIFLKDKKSVYISCNENYARDLKITSNQISGKTDYDFYPTELAEKYRSDDKRILELGVIEDIEEPYIVDGKQIWVHTVKTPIRDEKGKIWGVLGIFWDITERKQAEEALKKREAELRIKTRSLEEVNTALRILLKKKDEVKLEIEENVLNNVKELVIPYLEKLKKQRLDEVYNVYLNILESNLNDIISPFSQKLSSKYINLTPTEIRVANLIKYGNNTKEIAELLFLSKTTIEFHRRNIRKKLGIKDKKTNLRTHLLSIT
jgi:PAS domain S-box-containing protein